MTKYQALARIYVYIMWRVMAAGDGAARITSFLARQRVEGILEPSDKAREPGEEARPTASSAKLNMSPHERAARGH